MKTFSECVKPVKQNDFNQEDPIDEKSAEIVNYMFNRLESIVPSMKYTHDSTVSLGRIKKEFIYELRSNNITQMEVINFALNKIRAKGLKFIPTPGEFVSFCKPEPLSLGAPTHAAAYSEAIKRSHPSTKEETWSHPAVHHAWFETGSRALQDATGSYQIVEVRNIFYANYDMTLKMLASGEKLRPLPKLIAKPAHVKEVTSVGMSALEALRKI